MFHAVCDNGSKRLWFLLLGLAKLRTLCTIYNHPHVFLIVCKHLYWTREGAISMLMRVPMLL